MNIDEAMAFIHQISWRGSKLGLARITELLHRLGDPQEKLRFIHVAGTNGKGSTCSMLASVLTLAGYRTGLYTSPFIRRFNERIKVDGRDISDGELTALVERVRPQAEAMEDLPTEFEVITAIAFLYYLEMGCDAVVLEVGLGGRLDSTNVIKAPHVAVITRIGLDHTQILGHTVGEIAAEKAGIIKSGCRAVLAPQEPEAEAVLTAKCAELGVPAVQSDMSALRPLRHSLEGQSFCFGPWQNMELGLLGAYQLENAATVLTAVAVLRELGYSLPDEAVRRGLKEAQWPGRFELLHREPVFLIDGAHNPNGAAALGVCLDEYLPGVRPVFLMGVMADKDHRGIISALAPRAGAFVTVTPRNSRALPSSLLKAEIEELYDGAVKDAGEVEQGVAAALEMAASSGAAVAMGSLYMSGDVRGCFGKYNG